MFLEQTPIDKLIFYISIDSNKCEQYEIPLNDDIFNDYLNENSLVLCFSELEQNGLNNGLKYNYETFIKVY